MDQTSRGQNTKGTENSNFLLKIGSIQVLAKPPQNQEAIPFALISSA